MTVARFPTGGSIESIPDVLQAVVRAQVETCQIAGFAAVMEPAASNLPSGTGRALAMREAFRGPYGASRGSNAMPGFEWATALPGSDQVLSTWSEFQDERGICVVEGEFYAEAFGHRPRIGSDPDLARSILARVLDSGSGQIDQLNGLFSGFVFSRALRRLWLFVDRVGARLLFYREVDGGWEVASDLYGFGGGGASLRVDPLALNEQLILGQPAENRTLFRGIRLVPPGQVVELSMAGAVETPYYRFPSRLARQPAAEGAEMVCSALDRHVRDLGVRSGEFGIALSGGKDSRVVLGALLRSSLAPWAATFMTGAPDPDGENAVRLARAASLSVSTVGFNPAWKPTTFDWDSAVMSLGYTASWGTVALAAAAALKNRPILTGYTGDVLSGASFGIQPWRMRSSRELAMGLFSATGPAISPDLAFSSLRRDLRVPREEVLESWVRSFGPDNGDDLLTSYLRQRLNHRNRWRAGLNFHMMRMHSVPVHPYADRRVMDAYLSLPLSSFRCQLAHCRAASLRLPALAAIPTGGSPIPLKFECRLQCLGATVKGWNRRLRRRRRVIAARTGGSSGPLSARHERMLETSVESGLFEPSFLRNDVWKEGTNRSGIIKLGAIAIHFACASGRTLPSGPAPLFLEKTGGQRLAAKRVN